MFVGIGTLINVLAILIGTFLGRLFGNRISLRTRDLLTDVLGAVTLIGAASALTSLFKNELASALPDGFPILIVLGSLILGGLLGSWLRIQDRLNNLGVTLKERFAASENSASNENFVAGFVTASLIFVIGPLAILGSISDGMSTGIDQLLLKSILDFFASIAFAASLGWGVAFSAIPVGIYQALWTVVGFGLGNILNDYQVQAMTATGGVLLLGIAFKLLKIKEIAIGDLLPALALAPLLALLAASI
ncbi:MAG: DUF554 domain-containing protein [Actinobacteria bacterium]|nr:DUF554 domain-containing protein [Actinomycetota bacterium]